MKLVIFLISLLLLLCGSAKVGHADQSLVTVAVMPAKLIGFPDDFSAKEVSSGAMELLEEALAEASEGRISIQTGDPDELQEAYEQGELSVDIVIIPRITFEVGNGLDGQHKVFLPILVDIRVQKKGGDKGLYTLLFSKKSETDKKRALGHVSESWIIKELNLVFQGSAKEVCEDLFLKPEPVAKATGLLFEKIMLYCN